MTASVSSAYAGAGPSKHTGLRIAVGVLGVATVVVGVVLLFNPVAAAHTLALLLGLAFVLGGLLEIAVGWDSGRRGLSVVLGAILVIGGCWPPSGPASRSGPSPSITGLSLIAARHRPGRARRRRPGRDPRLGLAGPRRRVRTSSLGVVAIAWPQATVLVLSPDPRRPDHHLRPAAARRRVLASRSPPRRTAPTGA